MTKIFLQVEVDDDGNTDDYIDRMKQVLIEDLLEEDGVEAVEAADQVLAVMTVSRTGSVTVHGPCFSQDDAEEIEDSFDQGAFIISLENPW